MHLFTIDQKGNQYCEDLAHSLYQLQLYRGRVKTFQDHFPEANGLKLNRAALIHEGYFFSPGMQIRIVEFRRL